MIKKTTIEKIVTIEQHILAEQSAFPDATGSLTNLLYDLALVGKLVARKMNQAGLVEILGMAGGQNVQGEQVKKLDVYANDVIVELIKKTGRVVVLGSEEMENAISMSGGKYVLLVDPLDGSSNIDFDVSIGTIFSIYRRKSKANEPGTVDDCLQPGTELVAAGYILYGSSIMMVYSTGNGVNGFTLDPGIGEFLLSHPKIEIPDPIYYSANMAYISRWSKPLQEYASWLKDEYAGGLSLRYIGSMVADVHRTLLGGGVFFYPPDTRMPNGKLRLLYEAIPMAYLVEQAGGKSSDGQKSILEIVPEELHERTPLYIGNTELIEKVEELLGQNN